ncbi:HEPN domain-containing protein [Salinibacter ruber]|uniref:HEPN domain-containing protein n=1 Tax=Salinibacter ruber TaxID=146919 RepID=UPI0013E8BC62
MIEGDEPTSHAGILSRFSHHFIRTVRTSEEVGKVLARAETDRNRADYDAVSVFEIQAAEDLVSNVSQFTKVVHRVVENHRE